MAKPPTPTSAMTAEHEELFAKAQAAYSKLEAREVKWILDGARHRIVKSIREQRALVLELAEFKEPVPAFPGQQHEQDPLVRASDTLASCERQLAAVDAISKLLDHVNMVQFAIDVATSMRSKK